MTNKLLSDEELYEKLEDMHYKLENTQHTNWDEYNNTLSGFTDLVNTQKRLYAEMVVGEDIDLSAKHIRKSFTAKEIPKLIATNQLRAEQRARIEENRRWLTVLAPSMDENVAYNSDFHHRIAELKAQQEEV